MNDDGIRSITYRRVIDLSHSVTPDIPLWPGDPAVDFQTVSGLADQDYFLRRFSMGEHSGTHLASPSAYYADGIDPDGIPAESLVAPAAVIGVQSQASLDPDYILSAGDIADWERTHGPIDPNTLVLLNTGWSRFWDRPARFINTGDDGAMHTPGFSLEAARFLLEWREVAGLGIDTHGIDAGADTGLAVSRLVLARPGAGAGVPQQPRSAAAHRRNRRCGTAAPGRRQWFPRPGYWRSHPDRRSSKAIWEHLPFPLSLDGRGLEPAPHSMRG